MKIDINHHELWIDSSTATTLEEFRHELLRNLNLKESLKEIDTLSEFEIYLNLNEEDLRLYSNTFHYQQMNNLLKQAVLSFNSIDGLKEWVGIKIEKNDLFNVSEQDTKSKLSFFNISQDNSGKYNYSVLEGLVEFTYDEYTHISYNPLDNTLTIDFNGVIHFIEGIDEYDIKKLNIFLSRLKQDTGWSTVDDVIDKIINFFKFKTQFGTNINNIHITKSILEQKLPTWSWSHLDLVRLFETKDLFEKLTKLYKENTTSEETIERYTDEFINTLVRSNKSLNRRHHKITFKHNCLRELCDITSINVTTTIRNGDYNICFEIRFKKMRDIRAITFDKHMGNSNLKTKQLVLLLINTPVKNNTNMYEVVMKTINLEIVKNNL